MDLQEPTVAGATAEHADNFERALAQMREWKFVKNLLWNWQNMSVFMKHPDDKSMMTKSYLCMKIEWNAPDSEPSVVDFVPRIPSQLDLIRWEWIIVG